MDWLENITPGVYELDPRITDERKPIVTRSIPERILKFIVKIHSVFPNIIVELDVNLVKFYRGRKKFFVAAISINKPYAIYQPPELCKRKICNLNEIKKYCKKIFRAPLPKKKCNLRFKITDSSFPIHELPEDILNLILPLARGTEHALLLVNKCLNRILSSREFWNDKLKNISVSQHNYYKRLWCGGRLLPHSHDRKPVISRVCAISQGLPCFLDPQGDCYFNYNNDWNIIVLRKVADKTRIVKNFYAASYAPCVIFYILYTDGELISVTRPCVNLVLEVNHHDTDLNSSNEKVLAQNIQSFNMLPCEGDYRITLTLKNFLITAIVVYPHSIYKESVTYIPGVTNGILIRNEREWEIIYLVEGEAYYLAVNDIESLAGIVIAKDIVNISYCEKEFLLVNNNRQMYQFSEELEEYGRRRDKIKDYSVV